MICVCYRPYVISNITVICTYRFYQAGSIDRAICQPIVWILALAPAREVYV